MQLLRTKLFLPAARAEELPRPALLARLDAGIRASRRLTLVAAPAGFGKTTLVVRWLAPMQAAWLTLDAGDNDPLRFARYLAAALAGTWPDALRSVTELLETPQPVALPDVCAAIINLFAERDPSAPPAILALDDYHTLTLPAVHQALAMLIEHLPPQLHVVLLTREDPPLPLARLRAAGRMTELRTDDLRFTLDESAQFLHRVAGVPLSAGQVALLHERTEGWAAGLQLAALSLQGTADPAPAIAAFSGDSHVVLDYLIEEVFARQPGYVQRFWMTTAILDRMCADLCDTLLHAADHTFNAEDRGSGQYTGGIGAHELLDYLQRANLFVTPLDPRRQWYRYHQLFADLLRSRLLRDMPEQALLLHRIASDWFARHDLPAEAIRHACAAGDFSVAANLVARQIPSLLYQNEVRSVCALVEALPVDLLHTMPDLTLGYTRALISAGRIVEAGRALDRLAAAPLTPAQQLALQTIRAVIAGAYGDLDTLDEYAQQVLAQLPDTELDLRGTLAFSMALAYNLRGDVGAALHHCVYAVECLQATGTISVLLVALHILAGLYVSAGDLHAASATYTRALRQATLPGGMLLSVAGALLIGMSGVAYEHNELDQAEDYARRGIDLCRRWGNTSVQAEGAAMLACVLHARGESGASAEAIAEANMLIAGLDETLPSVAHIHTLSMALEDVPAVALHIVEAPVEGLLPVVAEERRLTAMRILLRAGRADPVMPQLYALRETALAAGHTGRALEALAAEAAGLFIQGRSEQAAALLADALAAAAPQGYARTFIDLGAPMAALLERFAADPKNGESQCAYALWLRKQIPSTAPKVRGPVESAAPVLEAIMAPLTEPLSEREIEVLRLTASGLSNNEIAERLILAPGTIKRHLHNIFGKLAVTDRLQAVNKGRALGLLE